jgi:hypothetical protein
MLAVDVTCVLLHDAEGRRCRARRMGGVERALSAMGERVRRIDGRLGCATGECVEGVLRALESTLAEIDERG